VAARNFRGTIRQESIAPSASGGRTSASPTWSRDRREEFNSRPPIADTIDTISRPVPAAYDAVAALLTAHPRDIANTLRPSTIRLHLRKSARPHGNPAPGGSNRLRSGGRTRLVPPPVETEDSPKPAMHRSGTQAVNRPGLPEVETAREELEFQEPRAVRAQCDPVIDAGGHVAEMRWRHVFVCDRLEVEHVDCVLRAFDKFAVRRRPNHRIGQLGRRVHVVSRYCARREQLTSGQVLKKQRRLVANTIGEVIPVSSLQMLF
jgi:hypothetical protein